MHLKISPVRGYEATLKADIIDAILKIASETNSRTLSWLIVPSYHGLQSQVSSREGCRSLP